MHMHMHTHMCMHVCMYQQHQHQHQHQSIQKLTCSACACVYSGDATIAARPCAPCPQGAVVRAEVAADRDGGSKGFGTVEMGTTRDAAKAIQLLNDSDFKGGRLDVRPDAFA